MLKGLERWREAFERCPTEVPVGSFTVRLTVHPRGHLQAARVRASEPGEARIAACLQRALSSDGSGFEPAEGGTVIAQVAVTFEPVRGR